MLIPRMRTPAEMAEIMRRQEAIRPLPYSQFGAAAPAFWAETDEPLLEPHQTYYTTSWGREMAERSAARMPPHSAIGSPIEWSWIEELEARTEAMRPYGRQELGLAVEQEGYVAVPRRIVRELGRTAVPQVHEYTAVPRRYVTGLGVPAVPPRHGYVAMPRRLVTGLGQPTAQFPPYVSVDDVFANLAVVSKRQGTGQPADIKEYELVMGGLNAANIFSQAQVTLPGMSELLRAAILYIAKFKGTRKFGDLTVTPVQTKTYIDPVDFDTKVQWGIAFIRFFLANPDRYQISYQDRGARWWNFEDFTGLSNYVPAEWW